MRCPYWVQLLTQIQHDISNGHPIWLALKNAVSLARSVCN